MIFRFKKHRSIDKFEVSSTNNKDILDNNLIFSKDPFIQKIENTEKKTLEAYGQFALSHIAKEKEILQGVIFILDESEQPARLKFTSGYACNNEFNKELSFEPGEGLSGQVFQDKKLLNLKDIPEGYVKIRTGLGEASPTTLLFVPLVAAGVSLGVMEIASFQKFSKEDEQFFMEISDVIGRHILNIKEINV